MPAMSPTSQFNAARPSRIGKRSAFTLLEVLLALGILGVLLTIIWSMMENFQSLEQRGHQQRIARGH